MGAIQSFIDGDDLGSGFHSRHISVAGPTVRNSLHDSLRDPAVESDRFRRELKTHLFADVSALEVSPFHGIALYKSKFTYFLTYFTYCFKMYKLASRGDLFKAAFELLLLRIDRRVFRRRRHRHRRRRCTSRASTKLEYAKADEAKN